MKSMLKIEKFFLTMIELKLFAIVKRIDDKDVTER